MWLRFIVNLRKKNMLNFISRLETIILRSVLYSVSSAFKCSNAILFGVVLLCEFCLFSFLRFFLFIILHAYGFSFHLFVWCHAQFFRDNGAWGMRHGKEWKILLNITKWHHLLNIIRCQNLGTTFMLMWRYLWQFCVQIWIKKKRSHSFRFSSECETVMWWVFPLFC